MSKPKFYQGVPPQNPPGAGVVMVDGTRLNPRHGLACYSAGGFMWGQASSGPAQLSLAILAEEFDDRFALANYRAFKRQVVACLDRDKAWDMTSRMLRDWASEFATVPT